MMTGKLSGPMEMREMKSIAGGAGGAGVVDSELVLVAAEEERISCFSPHAIKSVATESFSYKHRDCCTSHIHTNPSTVKHNRKFSCASSSAHSAPIKIRGIRRNPLNGASRCRFKFCVMTATKCDVNANRTIGASNGRNHARFASPVTSPFSCLIIESFDTPMDVELE